MGLYRPGRDLPSFLLLHLSFQIAGYASWINQYPAKNSVLADILESSGAVLYVKTNVPQTLMVGLSLLIHSCPDNFLKSGQKRSIMSSDVPLIHITVHSPLVDLRVVKALLSVRVETLYMS